MELALETLHLLLYYYYIRQKLDSAKVDESKTGTFLHPQIIKLLSQHDDSIYIT